MSISEERKQRVQAKIGHLVEVMWETAIYCTSDYKVSVRCLIDGDIQVRYVSDLNKGCYRCRECLKSKYKSIAESNNFELLSVIFDKAGSFCILRCKYDGEFLKVKTTNILHQKKLHCQECRVRDVIDKLTLNSCHYVRSFTENKRLAFVEYLSMDGKLRVCSEQNALKESFAKVESHWDQPHNVYIIVNKVGNDTYVKIGTANNPANRLKSLKLTGACSVYTIENFSTRHAADRFEKELHQRFKEFRISKELASTFTNGMSKVGVKMGITEWFSSEVLDIVKENNYANDRNTKSKNCCS